ncbi:hypothetical protein Tco_1081302 [Tanacetum coccineum]|uniref:Uncharacterized protein n=1 Tax=Tanacetum coccineum TaxID=301880 RepID=A0ABQ5HYT2_9ASTR
MRSRHHRLNLHLKVDSKNLLDKVFWCTSLFSLPECLKADNMIRVNHLVTISLIKSSIHRLDQNRYPVDTSLIHIESRKSPTAVLLDVNIGRISIRHCETEEYHSEYTGNITRIMRRNLNNHLCSLFVNGKQTLELCPNVIYNDLVWL